MVADWVKSSCWVQCGCIIIVSFPGASPPPDFGRSQYLKQGNKHCKWSLTGGRTGHGTKPSFPAGFKLVDRGRLCMSRAWENEANKKILACSFV